MRHLKRDLQRAIEHIVCYTLNDISLRSKKIGEYLDENKEIIPGANDMETKFREVLVEDYSVLMQRYAVNLFPLFKYIDKEMPEVKVQMEPLKVLYANILERGNFKNGCNCFGCSKYKPRCWEKGGHVSVPIGNMNGKEEK